MKRCLVFLLLFLLPGIAFAETMQLIVEGTTAQGNTFTGKGTCFVVGRTDEGKVVVVTARHNFKGAERGSVIKGGRYYSVEKLRTSDEHDVASFESNMPYGGEYELRQTVERIKVEALGFGPKYHGRPSCGWTGEMVGTQFMQGDGGLHSCVGDSGGPVIWRGRYVVGLITGATRCESTPTVRNQYAQTGAQTVVTDSGAIHQHLTQQYQRSCGPNGCVVWLRPQIQQPQFMGIPTGPPRVVGVTPPIDSIGVVSRPSVPQVQGPAPSVSAPLSPAVQPAEVSAAAVKQALSELIKENPAIFRGPAGPAGPAGKDAVATERPLKVWVTKGGVFQSEQIVQPGKPLVLDTQALMGASDAK